VKSLDGLTDAEVRSTPTVSSLSLLGLLKHKTLWEKRWFQTVVDGRVVPGEWPASDDDWTVADFSLTDDDTVSDWLDRHRAAVAMSQEIVAGMDLEDTCKLERYSHRNVRSVLLHMIEEYARHCGHADIIRETILADRPVHEE
jgi:hypothetical protein